MPSSIDMPMNNSDEHAMKALMSFRRERYWFLNFIMTPFKDIDHRTVPESAPRLPARRPQR